MRLRAEQLDVRPPNRGTNAIHRTHEVLDHAVGLGVGGIEPIQLAVDDEVDARELLEVEHHRGGISQSLFAWMSHQPRRVGIAADQGGLDASGHSSCTYWMSTPSAR